MDRGDVIGGAWIDGVPRVLGQPDQATAYRACSLCAVKESYINHNIRNIMIQTVCRHLTENIISKDFFQVCVPFTMEQLSRVATLNNKLPRLQTHTFSLILYC
jgi:hypothetical protein